MNDKIVNLFSGLIINNNNLSPNLLLSNVYQFGLLLIIKIWFVSLVCCSEKCSRNVKLWCIWAGHLAKLLRAILSYRMFLPTPDCFCSSVCSLHSSDVCVRWLSTGIRPLDNNLAHWIDSWSQSGIFVSSEALTLWDRLKKYKISSMITCFSSPESFLLLNTYMAPKLHTEFCPFNYRLQWQAVEMFFNWDRSAKYSDMITGTQAKAIYRQQNIR